MPANFVPSAGNDRPTPSALDSMLSTQNALLLPSNFDAENVISV